MGIAYWICWGSPPRGVFSKKLSESKILTHLMFFVLRGACIHAILTCSAHEIRRIVFRQIFGPCATAGGLETFPTRGCCRGGFLRCGAARHGGSWGAPLPWAWPRHARTTSSTMAQGEGAWGTRMCDFSPLFAIFHYLRGLFHHDMGNSNCFLTHFWGVNWSAKMMCYLLFRKSWYLPVTVA